MARQCSSQVSFVYFLGCSLSKMGAWRTKAPPRSSLRHHPPDFFHQKVIEEDATICKFRSRNCSLSQALKSSKTKLPTLRSFRTQTSFREVGLSLRDHTPSSAQSPELGTLKLRDREMDRCLRSKKQLMFARL